MKRTDGHPEAPLVQRLRGGGDDVGVVGEAEVVVGAEVQRLGRWRSSTCADCGRGELALVLGQSPAASISARVAWSSSFTAPYMRSLLGGRQGARVRRTAQLQSRTTLPHCPERAASKASCHCSAGKRWVITDATRVAQDRRGLRASSS